jgi:WD40 repeat protein
MTLGAQWHPLFGLVLVLAPSVATVTPCAYAQRRVLEAPRVFRGYVAISPDGKLLATGGSDIRLWDLVTGKQLWAVKGHPDGVARIAFSPDGKNLASGGWLGDPKVRIWEGATGKPLRELGTSQYGVYFVAYSPDGKTLASCMDSGVAIWDLKSGTEKWRVKTSRPVDSIAISPDGRLLASAHGDQTVSLWEIKSGKHVRKLPAEQTIATGSQAVVFAPDGKVLATAGFTDGNVQLWDITTGIRIRSFGIGRDMIYSLAYAPDGKTIATTDGYFVRLWEVATGRQLRQWAPHWVVYNLAITPDGKMLAWYAGDQVVLQPVNRD